MDLPELYRLAGPGTPDCGGSPAGSNPGSRRLGRALLAVGCVLWITVVTGGMAVVWTYSNTAGVPADAPAVWPSDLRLEQEHGSATLVMLAHPHCPCTRASIGELSRIMTRPGGPVTAHVVFYRPGDFAPDWEKTDLWRSAEQIPGVRVHRDEEGHLARKFGTSTSGQVLLYDRRGQLRFSGGITAARGHAGDNAGSTILRRLLADERHDASQTAVYGCPLLGPDCPDC